MSYTLQEILTSLPQSDLTVTPDLQSVWKTQIIESVTWDWKKATATSLYVCLEKEEFQEPHIQENSLLHQQEAYQQGARFFLANQNVKINLPDCITINYNGNLNQALSLLLRKIYNNPFQNIHVIGITGTNGKTTTTQFLDALYRADQKRTGVIGTIGICYPSHQEPSGYLSTPMATELFPIAKKMKKDKTDTLFMEITSHSMAFDRVHTIDFHGGIFTNLTQDHMDFHKTMEHYLSCKTKFFASLGKNKPALALVNKDDPYANQFISSLSKRALLTKQLQYFTYSTRDHSADFYGELVSLSSSSLSFNLYIQQKLRTTLTLPITGIFNFYNALATASFAYTDHIPLSIIEKTFRHIPQISGRFEHIEIENKPYEVYIDYAHTPDALTSILTAVKQQTKNNLHLVFGCGGNRDTSKRSLMGQQAALFADYIWITSDNPREEDPLQICEQIYDGITNPSENTKIILNRKEAIHCAIEELKEGDSLLIAGKGHETYQIIGKTKYPFSDRKIVLEYLK